MFKQKVQKLVEDQDYFSQTDNSDSGAEDDENLLDRDKQLAQIFFKKSVAMQKDGSISLLKIIQKE